MDLQEGFHRADADPAARLSEGRVRAVEAEDGHRREDQEGARLHAPAVPRGSLHCLLPEGVCQSRVGHLGPLASLLHGREVGPAAESEREREETHGEDAELPE